MNSQPKFPVFIFQPGDHMIYVYHSERKLRSTNTKILKTLGFQGLRIIDSIGKVYKIKNATKSKYLGLWGFNPLVKGRQVLVVLEYEDEVSQISLDDFKIDIKKRIMEKKNFWEASGDISELHAIIDKANSFEEIANFLK